MAWTGEAPTYLFHYTEAEHAEEIADDGHFRVGTGANFGFGLYATGSRTRGSDSGGDSGGGRKADGGWNRGNKRT